MTRYVELAFDQVIHDTGEATLIAFGDQATWIPHTCFEDFSEFDEDDSTVSIAEWKANEEGLI